ncbi:hypothetical protein HPB50_028398 [Hyalomma asiaticum]|nr:hypothetical protein HPB50_028398 [Hyalomma asiaticum]
MELRLPDTEPELTPALVGGLFLTVRDKVPKLRRRKVLVSCGTLRFDPTGLGFEVAPFLPRYRSLLSQIQQAFQNNFCCAKDGQCGDAIEPSLRAAAPHPESALVGGPCVLASDEVPDTWRWKLMVMRAVLRADVALVWLARSPRDECVDLRGVVLLGGDEHSEIGIELPLANAALYPAPAILGGFFVIV